MDTKEMKSKKGITLIALIITVIILLILAGVTINAIVSDNGVIGHAQETSKGLTVSKFLEDSVQAYSEIYAEKATTQYSINVTIEEIIEKLENGYDYKDKFYIVPEGALTGIIIEADGKDVNENKTIIIDKKSEKIFKVIPITSSNNTDYYVEIQGMYYPMTLDDTKVVLGEGTENKPIQNESELTIEESSSLAYITATTNKNDLTVKVKGGTQEGLDNLKINYDGQISNIKIEVKTRTVANTLVIEGDRENTENTEDTEKIVSPFVQYVDKNGNKILCKVLYDMNDEGTGVQIVSLKALDNFIIGSSDPIYEEETNSFERARQSYNHAIENLNKFAIDNYLNESLSPANGGRCIGSNPINPNNEGEMYTVPEEYLAIFQNSGKDLFYDNNDGQLTGRFRDVDNNWEKDIQRLRLINAEATENSRSYWLASRATNENKYINNSGSYGYLEKYFYINYMECYSNNSSHIREDTIFYASSYGSYSSNSYGTCYRPVFTLKPNVKIVGGTGLDKKHPYILAEPTED